MKINKINQMTMKTNKNEQLTDEEIRIANIMNRAKSDLWFHEIMETIDGSSFGDYLRNNKSDVTDCLTMSMFNAFEKRIIFKNDDVKNTCLTACSNHSQKFVDCYLDDNPQNKDGELTFFMRKGLVLCFIVKNNKLIYGAGIRKNDE